MSSGHSSINSSSAIGPTGNSGPVGLTGNIGPIGNTAAASGNTGERGDFLQTIAFGDVYYDISGVLQSEIRQTYTKSIPDIIYYSDPAKIYGPTLFDAFGIRGKTFGDIGILVGVTTTGILGAGSTAIFQFKDIVSITSGISITSDSTFIKINSNVASTQIIIGNTCENDLAYIQGVTQVGSTRLGFTSDEYSQNYLYINKNLGSTLNFNALNVETKNVNVLSVAKNIGTSTYLDISAGGVFFINTPVGIHGFTGISGLSGATGDIISATLFFVDDDVWHFPQNIWFDADQAHLTPGANILNVYSTNNGANWTANFFGRGYGATPNSVPANILGSCCGANNIGCIDYMSQKACTNRGLTFNWCPLTTKLENVSGITQAYSCCMNNKCVDDVMYDMCIKYGGRTSRNPCNVRACYDPCGPLTSCCGKWTGTVECKDGYSYEECIFEIGGTTWNAGPCSNYDSNCELISPSPADYVGKAGPCCYVSGGNVICQELNSDDCSAANGIYHGGVDSCATMNCGCYTIADFGSATVKSTESPSYTNEELVRLYLTPTEYVCIYVTDTPENLLNIESC